MKKHNILNGCKSKARVITIVAVIGTECVEISHPVEYYERPLYSNLLPANLNTDHTHAESEALILEKSSMASNGTTARLNFGEYNA